MKLVEYLFRNGIKQTDFAQNLGVTNTYVGQILAGRVPSISLAKGIEEITEREVLKEELLFPDEF